MAKAPGTSADVRFDAERCDAQFGKMQEVTTYGEESAKTTLFHWLVCDGEKKRGIRDALVASLYKQIGVASGMMILNRTKKF